MISKNLKLKTKDLCLTPYISMKLNEVIMESKSLKIKMQQLERKL